MVKEDIAVTKFREYLRINTEQPNPDYESCKDFLFNLSDELGIYRYAASVVPEKPFIIMTISGSSPELPSLMLYSHTDVVPTFREHWTYDPYEAYKDDEGNIYARGAQDMKCVGSQYFEAIRKHFALGKKQWKRSIHIVWGPEEETGGPHGMEEFCKTEDFKKLNIGFVLDEGLASENDIYKVFYAERNCWWIKFTCAGSPGHGSKFIENTAVEKLQSVMNSVLTFRSEQLALLNSNPDFTLGDVTTMNMTMIEGGVQTNVLPEKITACVDIRMPPSIDHDALEAKIASWCQAAGEGVSFEFLEKLTVKTMTPTTMEDPWWAAISNTFDKLDCKFTKEIFVAATDSRFLRGLGLPCIGFSPMINTKVLLHDHNEYLNEKVFLRGVEIYFHLIDALANV